MYDFDFRTERGLYFIVRYSLYIEIVENNCELL